MWIKNRSQFLLIKIKTARAGITLPVSLFVLEDIVESLGDIISLLDYFIPASGKIPIRPGEIARLCRTALNELRNQGRWELVDIEVNNTRIYIGFY